MKKNTAQLAYNNYHDYHSALLHSGFVLQMRAQWPVLSKCSGQ